MKEKTHKDFIAWVHTQVKYYAPILGLELHRVDIEYDDDTDFLRIGCTYPYLDPTIWFSEKAFAKWSAGKMNKDRILHELCHILTDPLYCKALERHVSVTEIKDEREKLTDTIAAIIRKMDR